MNMAYIYSIVNKINNKAYIGQTIQINLYNRIRKHFSLLRNNSHPNIKLQNAFNKYGENNFYYFPLCECLPSELNELEIKYIKLFDTFKTGYNMTEGGQGIISKEAQLQNKISNQNRHPNVLKIDPNSLEVIKIYNGENETAREENINLSAVSKSCKDKGRIIHGFIYIKDSDYISSWKPHIRTNAIPCCFINTNNYILSFFESKREAMRKLNYKKTSDIDRIINQHLKIKNGDEEGFLIQLSQQQYYEYSIGTCIDYPR